jgi:hypothetical protein
LGPNERRAAGRQPRAGADERAGIDDARAPHVAVVTLADARAARIAARIVFTAAAVARQPTRLAECPSSSIYNISTRFFRSRFKSTGTMPPVKKPPVKKSIKKPKGGKFRWVIGPPPKKKGTTPSLAQLSKKGARKAWVQRMGAYDSD